LPNEKLSSKRSHSRSPAEEASSSCSSSKSHSPPFTESRKITKKIRKRKAAPKSRSRSRAPAANTQIKSPPGARIAARAASDRNAARTANPNSLQFEDRAIKEQGVYLNSSQPKCMMGHILTFPYVSALVPHVQPSCHLCPQRFAVGSTICVCHQCEPIFFSCVRCTFKIASTDSEDQN
jgi:hypothetical protein